MYTCYANAKQAPSKALSVLQDTIYETLAANFNSHAPPATMMRKLEWAEEVADLCEKRIQKAREERNGKLTVKRNGAIIDDNGHRVEAFAFEAGRLEVEGSLYSCFVVDLLYGEGYVLLVRSDIKLDFYRLFPNIGTARDWRILQKCIEQFSPRSASCRWVIDFQQTVRTAAKNAATAYVNLAGIFQQRDLDVLQCMAPAKMHMLDLCSIITLSHTIPVSVVPRLLHVVVTRSSIDLEEVRRVFRAWDFAAGTKTSGLEVPSILVKGKRDLDAWRSSSRFAYVTYGKAQGPDYILAAMEQSLALDDNGFQEQFPYPLVLVGSSIWSDRSCVELDMRNLRFSDEELLVGRKYLASILCRHNDVMESLTTAWRQKVTAYEAAITPYPQLWYNAFHFAIGMVLFSTSATFIDYIGFTRDADAQRLRLRTDRAKRYADALEKLKVATREDSWLYPAKPSIKAEALALLKKDYDAFLHHLQDGTPVMAFTESSLAHCFSLESTEISDFILKLKENHLLEHRTHPITFKNREQDRFICIRADAITVAAGS